MACQAIKAALDDAGIHPSEVDGLASYTLEPFVEVEIARNLGMGDITFFSQVGYGGGAGCGVVGQAAMAGAPRQGAGGGGGGPPQRGLGPSRPWAHLGPPGGRAGPG